MMIWIWLWWGDDDSVDPCSEFWVLGHGTVRLSHFQSFLWWYWYDDVIVLWTIWTRVVKILLKFGSWGKFPGKKGSWTVRLSHFSKFLTDDMIWWCDMMIVIWRYDMMMSYRWSVDLCKKYFRILDLGANFLEKRVHEQEDLIIFQSFLLMIWYDDVIWWYDMTIWYVVVSDPCSENILRFWVNWV